MRKEAALALSLGLALAATPANAGIAENQVLVVYNSASADGTALLNAYLAAHPGVPAQNVVDLNATALLAASITQATFVASIRDPIRTYLLAAGSPGPEDIVAIALLRPLPHRIQDTDVSTAGDTGASAANEFNQGDATFSSVDADLVLLWQDLYGGEAGGRMDSLSDNLIDNPYHQSTQAINAFSRANITTAKAFVNRSNAVWTLGGSGSTRLTPGDMYLVCRIDGTTLDDALAEIDRAQNLVVNRAAVRTILDEFDVTAGDELDDDPAFLSNDPFLAGDDYEETAPLLVAGGWNVRYDDTADFISSAEEVTPLIAYGSYGENHKLAGENPPGAGTYIDGFNFARGAIFNTIESFNGRAFNGLGTAAGQEQVADFITAGGTFGVGNVFEPFSFSVPDNEFLMVNMLVRRMTWAEAAYTSIPALSWQQIVVGDPLARYETVGDLYGDCDADATVDYRDIPLFVDCVTGPDGGVPNGCQCADFDADGDVDLFDAAGYQAVFGQSIP